MVEMTTNEKLLVFSGFIPLSKNCKSRFKPIVHVIIAAPSKKDVAKIMGRSLSFIDANFEITFDRDICAKALSHPNLVIKI